MNRLFSLLLLLTLIAPLALAQAPTPDNGMVAICTATVETSKGSFAGIGDADPENVNRKIAPHIIRMAETRAKARALRDAVNIGLVSLEELGDLTEVTEEPAHRPVQQRAERDNVRPLHPQGEARQERTRESSPRGDDRSRDRGDGMSEAQRRLLFRVLAERGYEGQEAVTVLCETARVDNLGAISKKTASAILDQWLKAEGGGARGGSRAS